MQREWPLLGAVGVVLLVSLLAVLVLPGAITAPESNEYSRLHLEDIAVSHGPVGGETVPLAIQAQMQHHGGPAENVTVRFRAVGPRSGLVETTQTVAVGRVDDERETTVGTNLTVARSGGYRIDVVVYEDGQRQSSGSTEVDGVGSLVPAYADSTVDFHQFTGGSNALPVVEYAIESADENRTTLNISTYLTNSGAVPSADMRLVLKARQAESNILAAERTVRVGRIQPGTTATPATTLSVPSDYNYYLDAVLWKDDVIVTTARSGANLDPSETISVDQTRRDVGLEVSEFQRGTGGDASEDRTRETPAVESSGDGAGFGVGVAIVAVLAGLLAARRGGVYND